MSIRGGKSYAQEIPPAIKKCCIFLLILSDKAQQSKWVPREVDQAINRDKIIMPYMLENCPLRSDFSFYLTNVQGYEAFRESLDSALSMTADEMAIALAMPINRLNDILFEMEMSDLGTTVPGGRFVLTI